MDPTLSWASFYCPLSATMIISPPMQVELPETRAAGNQPSPPARIQLLDPLIAERIAAGEVIERPGSVVKELVENSIDAGATQIQVTLIDGGKNLIEILDNGHGMSAEDLRLAPLRHATSKLRTLADLERIATLGFRGEALPSIAAAGSMTLISRARGAEHAYELDLTDRANAPRAEPVTFGHFLGSEHGTRIQVSSLFAQIPARLKFLKSQASEVGFVREWLERLALTQPRVGFKLISNDRVILNLAPSSEEERVQALLADENHYPLVSASRGMESDGADWIKLRVHWIQGLSSPQLRKVVQVVNGRALKDRVLQQAVLSPFRQLLLPGQFPALALYVEIDPSQIDVNVHPTKTEIRFLDSRAVFHAVEKLIEKLVQEQGAPTFPVFAPESESAPVTPTFFSAPASAPRFPQWVMKDSSSAPVPAANLHAMQPEQFSFAHETVAAQNQARYCGQLFATYLLFQKGEEVWILDQHAAHERIRFEALRKSLPFADSQQLLLPEALKFSPELRVAIEERLPALNALGFELELYGDDALLARAVPAAWGNDDLNPRLKSLIDRVLETEPGDLVAEKILTDAKLFEKIASQACHGSVRAHDQLTAGQAQELYQNLYACENPWNCPHGRPTTLKMTEGKFEEWFQRKVPH